MEWVGGAKGLLQSISEIPSLLDEESNAEGLQLLALITRTIAKRASRMHYRSLDYYCWQFPQSRYNPSRLWARPALTKEALALYRKRFVPKGIITSIISPFDRAFILCILVGATWSPPGCTWSILSIASPTAIICLTGTSGVGSITPLRIPTSSSHTVLISLYAICTRETNSHPTKAPIITIA